MFYGESKQLQGLCVLTCASLAAILSSCEYAHFSSSDTYPPASVVFASPVDWLPKSSKWLESSVLAQVSWASSDACENTQVFDCLSPLSTWSVSATCSTRHLVLVFFFLGCTISSSSMMTAVLLTFEAFTPLSVSASLYFAGSLRTRAGHSLSRTCTSVRDGPPRVKETRGISLTRPVKPSEGTDRIGPPRTTRARTLNKHLPIQEKPGLKPGTRSYSQVTHVI